MTPPNSSATDRAAHTLTLERVIDAPRDLVWEAWTDEKHAAKWWAPKGFDIAYIEMDVRPGGGWKKCMRLPDGREFWRNGVYTEVEEPERLTFTYLSDDPNSQPGHETVVTVTFEARGDKTVVKLHQSVFETVAARDAHKGGWNSTLERIGEYVTAGRHS